MLRPRRRTIPLVQRTDHILARASGRRVLHLGCTNAPYTDVTIADGSLLHLQLRDVAAELHGLDIDRAGLARLAALGCQNLHAGDLHEVADDLAAHHTFDLIVAGEIIEHLGNPAAFLEAAYRLLQPGATLLITTVNAYCAFRMARYAVRGQGGYSEPVHPDHVAYYSYATLTRLVTSVGLEVAEVSFYDLGREHAPHLRRSLRWINRLAVTLAPHLADGIIVECRRPPELPA